jgi:hypothetical protein
MLDKLTLADFLPETGKRFRIEPGDLSALEVELVAATDLSRGKLAAGRMPFSLLFRGPFQPVLPQRIYAVQPVEASALERIEIFLVPVGPDESGMRYEAIFN